MAKQPVIAATLLLAVITGCSKSAPDGVSDPPQARPQDKRHQMESMRADCMKQKGFKYIANAPAPKKLSSIEQKRLSGDYTALKEFRKKYGYGVFSGFVYPDDRTAGGGDTRTGNPNNSIIMSLPKEKLEAYHAADKACYRQITKTVLGKEANSNFDLLKQLGARSGQIEAREINGDSKLLELANTFGNCLKKKGYPITSLKPTVLAGRGVNSFKEKAFDLGRRQAKNPENGADYLPNLTVEQARPYLNEEIKDALGDLECGKDFYAIYQPKYLQITQRMMTEFGVNFIDLGL